MTRLRSSLFRCQPESRPTPDEMEAMRGRAWREHGVVVLDPTSIADPWVRQMVINTANERYGARRA